MLFFLFQFLRAHAQRLLLAVALLTAVVAVSQCRQHAQHQTTLRGQLAQASDSAAHYRTRLGEEVAYNQVTIAFDQHDLRLALQKNEQLRRQVETFRHVTAAGSVRTVTQIKHVMMPFDTAAPIGFSRHVHYQAPHFRFAGRVNQHGLRVDSLSVSSRINFVIGEKKTGWLGLGRREYRIEATSDNPAVHVTNTEAHVLRPRKRFYQRTWFHLLLGAAISESRHFLPTRNQ